MSIRLSKVLLALGLMAAAAGASALPNIGVGNDELLGRYCGYARGEGGKFEVEGSTMAICEGNLQNAMNVVAPLLEVRLCWKCTTEVSLPLSGASGTNYLSPDTIQQFSDGIQLLRDRYRIDDYDREETELQRALSPAPRP